MEWSNEQLEAINKLKEFYKSDKDVIVLCGYAGVGKTAVMGEYIKYLEDNNIDYRLCAPTHKAKIVLEKFTNRSAITVHKLCQLSPKLDILRLDFADLQFHSSGAGEFPYKGIVIVDEASMVSDSLYDLLLEYCREFRSKLCFIGDIAQLQPVNNGNISKVFNNDNIIKLTKIFRQTETNQLTNLLVTLRNKVVTNFESSEDGSINIYHNINPFVVEAFKSIKESIEKRDLNFSKLIVYTNKRIAEYNKTFRKFLFKDNERYHIGELLVGCENYSNSTSEFHNSSDYIITKISNSSSYIPDYGFTPGFMLTLYDGEREQSVFVIDPDKMNVDDLARVIEETRLDAIKAKGRNKGIKWKKYYDIMGSFASPINLTFEDRIIRQRTFDYGYAISSHKSQGSSYNTVFVDMKNLLLDKDQLELRQLQYVALSRTRTNVNIYI